MKTIDAIWFTTPYGVVGIVVGEDEITKQRKAYIGAVPGNNEKDDIEIIKKSGAKIYIKTLKYIIRQLKSDKKIKVVLL